MAEKTPGNNNTRHDGSQRGSGFTAGAQPISRGNPPPPPPPPAPQPKK